MANYPGFADRVKVHCPLCHEKVTLFIENAEVERIVNEFEITSMDGTHASATQDQRIEARATYSYPHTCGAHILPTSQGV